MTSKRLRYFRYVLLPCAAILALGADVQCPGNASGRTSLSSLQAEVTALQAQVAALDIEVGVIGAEAEVPHVFDSDGVDLGIFAGLHARPGWGGFTDSRVFDIYMPGPRVLISIDSASGMHFIESGGRFFFTDPNCNSEPFTEFAGRLLQSNIGNDDVFLVSGTEAVEMSPAAASSRPFPQPSDDCNLTTEVGPFVLATQVDPVADLGLSFPQPRPLYVGLLSD